MVVKRECYLLYSYNTGEAKRADESRWEGKEFVVKSGEKWMDKKIWKRIAG
jgi:hypothetical protein